MPVPPYDWQRYRPGTDRNHLIKVGKEGKGGFRVRLVYVEKDEYGDLRGQIGMEIGGDIESLEIIEKIRWTEFSNSPKENVCVREIKISENRAEHRYEYPNHKALNRVDYKRSLFLRADSLDSTNCRKAFLSPLTINPQTSYGFTLKGKDENGNIHTSGFVFRYEDWIPDPEHEGFYKHK
jgi:hypothetical protein